MDAVVPAVLGRPDAVLGQFSEMKLYDNFVNVPSSSGIRNSEALT